MVPYATFQELLRSVALVGGLVLFFLLSGCAEMLHEARESYEAVFSGGANGDNSDPLAERGHREILAGNYREAEVYLQAALTANPTNPRALLYMGEVYEKTGRRDEAREMYAKVIALDPQVPAQASNTGDAAGIALADLARRNLAALDEAGEGAQIPAAPEETLTRLGVLEQLFARGLVSAAEFDGRRSSAAVSASAGAPSPLGVEAAARKLRDLEAYRESALITPQTYEAERLALLDSLVPAAPAVAEPAPETMPKTAPQTAALPEPAPSPAAPSATGYRLHVASYRTPDAALAGWNELRAANADLLDGLSPELSKIDLGPGQGVFYRVQAGPLAGEQAAKDLCTKLKSRNVYCVPVAPHA